MEQKNWRERIDELRFYTGSRWLADMWQKQKDETTIEIDLPTHSKKELKEIIDEILDQKDKEWQQRCKKAKTLTAKESYKNGRIIMKAEIREVIEKMKRPTLKKLRKAIKRANEDNTYMNGYHQALKEILNHIK